MKRVGILRGGKGSHYEKSLRDGSVLLAHISENLSDQFKPVDIFVDKDGAWHVNGLPVKQADLFHKVDVIWNASHPTLSKEIINFSIPHVGDNSFAKAIGESREMLAKHMKAIGVNMPRHIVLPPYQEDFDGPRERYVIKKAKEVLEKFPSPWIIKSYSDDPDMGVHVANTFAELADAIEDGIDHGESILVEELIVGKDISSHSLAGFRGQDIYTFPIGNFTQSEKDRINSIAKQVYTHINAAHYLKCNFLIHPKRGVFLKSISFSPDFNKDSDFHEICESVGAKADHVIEHLIAQALSR